MPHGSRLGRPDPPLGVCGSDARGPAGRPWLRLAARSSAGEARPSSVPEAPKQVEGSSPAWQHLRPGASRWNRRASAAPRATPPLVPPPQPPSSHLEPVRRMCFRGRDLRSQTRGRAPPSGHDGNDTPLSSRGRNRPGRDASSLIKRIKKSVEAPVSAVTSIAYDVQGTNVEEWKVTWYNKLSHWWPKLIGKRGIWSITHCP